MVLVLHTDQLFAEPSESPYQAWVGTDDFQHDFMRIKVVLVEILREWEEMEKKEGTGNLNATICDNLKHVEESLLGIVQECIVSMGKTVKGNLPRRGYFTLY